MLSNRSKNVSCKQEDMVATRQDRLHRHATLKGMQSWVLLGSDQAQDNRVLPPSKERILVLIQHALDIVSEKDVEDGTPERKRQRPFGN